MPNALKGEVGFEVEGEAYTLLLDFNALCELEAALAPGDDRNGPRASRATLWAALQRHHAELSLNDVGDLIAALTLPRVRELIGQAYDAAGLNEVLGGNPLKAPARKKTTKTGA
jgi:hypothetical protein